MSIKKKLTLSALSLLALAGCSSNKLEISSRLDEGFTPKSAYEIKEFMSKNITYKNEKRENWSSPKQTLRSGKGDCEDTAILGAYFAEKMGHPPKIIILDDNSNVSHAMTYLEYKTEQGNEYRLLGHKRIFVSQKSVKDAIKILNKEVDKNYDYYHILDLDTFNPQWRTTKENMIYGGKQHYLNFTPVGKAKPNEVSIKVIGNMSLIR
jgi:hypothetical protein